MRSHLASLPSRLLIYLLQSIELPFILRLASTCKACQQWVREDFVPRALFLGHHAPEDETLTAFCKYFRQHGGLQQIAVRGLSSTAMIHIVSAFPDLQRLSVWVDETGDKASSAAARGALGQLHQLTQLELLSCKYEGKVTFAFLKGMTNLRTLRLRSIFRPNQDLMRSLRQPLPRSCEKHILQCTSLTELNLNISGLSWLLPRLVALPNLCSLNISGSDVAAEHLPTIARLSQLEQLTLGFSDSLETRPQCLGHLSALMCLRKLDICNTFAADGNPCLRYLPLLPRLDSLRSDFNLDDSFSMLSRLSRLTKLHVSQAGSQAVPSSLGVLRTLTSLRSLDLSLFDTDSIDLDTWQSSTLPHLTTLRRFSCYAELPWGVVNSLTPGLRTLRVHLQPFEGSGHTEMRSFQHLSNLVSLHLQAHITDSLLSTLLGSLPPTLTDLDLSDNELTKDALPLFHSTGMSLRNVSLMSNGVSVAELEEAELDLQVFSTDCAKCAAEESDDDDDDDDDDGGEEEGEKDDDGEEEGEKDDGGEEEGEKDDDGEQEEEGRGRGRGSTTL